MDEGVPQAAVVRAAWADEATGNAVAGLRHGWGEVYRIGWDATRGYWANRRDGVGGDITAEDPDELRSAIFADYQLKPVPRPQGAP